jgi:formylglycine-generating enzyme required for sulfatase activity
MKKVFILLGFALLGGGAFGEVLSNAPANGYAYTCPVYTCITLPIEMVFVQGGTLQNKNTSDAITVQDFYIGKYEVTQKLWLDVMGSYPGAAPNSTYGLGYNYPMYYVSWEDAHRFIDSLNKFYGNGKFRLPTEAEWEYAAKGGSSQQSDTYAGSNTVGGVAWYTSNSSSMTHPVNDNAKVANTIGIYHMSGNVREWCQDWFDGSIGENAIPIPTPTSSTNRVLRGGGWNSDAAYCTVSYRNYGTPDYRIGSNGFRLACSSNP